MFINPGAISRTFSMNAASNWDYDQLKQQNEKANSELTALRRRYEHAMKVNNNNNKLIMIFIL